MRTGFFVVLARVELDPRNEVRHEDGPVAVVLRPEAVGRSVTVAHDILLRDGTLAATGRSVLVPWDREQRRSRPLTADERTALGAE